MIHRSSLFFLRNRIVGFGVLVGGGCGAADANERDSEESVFCPVEAEGWPFIDAFEALCRGGPRSWGGSPSTGPARRHCRMSSQNDWSTKVACIALVSMNPQSHICASPSPSLVVTSRLSSRSILLPTTMIPGRVCFRLLDEDEAIACFPLTTAS